MISRNQLRSPSPNGRGFSIIEVTVAIGIIGVSLIAIVGLLPIGLQTHHTADEEARAGSALNMVATAAGSLHYYNPQNAQPTWAFPRYFSDSATPDTDPTIVWVGQTAWSYTFFLSEAGMIIPRNDAATPRRQLLYVAVHPPQSPTQPVRLYAAVVWPARPTDTPGRDSTGTQLPAMTGRQGFVDTVVTFAPKLQYR